MDDYQKTKAEAHAEWVDSLDIDDAEWLRENDLYNRYDRVGKPRPAAPVPTHREPSTDWYWWKTAFPQKGGE